MRSLALAAMALGLASLGWTLVSDPQPAEVPWDYAVSLTATSADLVDLVTGDTIPLPAPNHPCDRPGYAIAAWGGIWKVGGSHSQKVEMFDPDLGAWTDWPDLPIQRTRPAVAFSGEKLYSFGGEEDSIYQNYCAVSDGTHWTTIPGIKTYKQGSGPYAKQFYLAQKGRVAIPLLDGRIALVGGASDGTRVDIFTPGPNTWANGPRLPEPVEYGYVVGGNTVWNPLSGSFWSLE
jgi:hypothetical protein